MIQDSLLAYAIAEYTVRSETIKKQIKMITESNILSEKDIESYIDELRNIHLRNLSHMLDSMRKALSTDNVSLATNITKEGIKIIEFDLKHKSNQIYQREIDK